MRSSVEEEKVEGRDVEVGGILLRMPRPITPLETSWNVPGVTILSLSPPLRLYIYIYIYVSFNPSFPFAQHLCVDLVKG